MSTATAEADTNKTKEDDKKKHPRDPAREVVETVVFVVVLVLLLKLFVTEAFVIPTGSMAETLYGYQKLITCAKCGHQFPVNTHDEVEVNSTTKRKHPLLRYVCPNCRHEGEVKELNPAPGNNSGDRVLVLKPLYHIRSPQRGDVVVFKFPRAPQTQHTAQNYIKRAMGFGGETIAIHRGELYVTKSLAYPEDSFPRPENPNDLWEWTYMYPNAGIAETLFNASRDADFTDAVPGGFRIVRKGEDQMLADRRIVWDNDKQPADLGPASQRWRSENPNAWTTDSPNQARAFSHKGDGLDWIRYQHLTWKRLQEGNQQRLVPWRWTDRDKSPPVAGPIDNMIGYNAGIDWNPTIPKEQSRDDVKGRPQELWVGDLFLECEVELAVGAEVVLELSKGADRFQAKFCGGKVTLARTGAKQAELCSRPCKVNAGTYKLRFANVDARLAVWVDDKWIDFGTESEYNATTLTEFDPEDTKKEGWTRANDIDAPASIGAKGQVSSVRHIKIHRDIYYTRSDSNDLTRADIFYVQPGHYMCLGDNSAQSSDSREWGVVPERLMLGKAVFVFFPVALEWKFGWPPVRTIPGRHRAGFIK
jgi:signal peptidase I